MAPRLERWCTVCALMPVPGSTFAFAVLFAALACGCQTTSSAPTAPTGAPSASSQEATTADEKAAQTAAEAWLALVDAGTYAQSWAGAASFFKGTVDEGRWEAQLNGARTPLGKVLSRTLKAVRYATTLPGAPDGQYVALQYATGFTNKQSAAETVTPMKDTDGQWRVSGYYIK
jgi:hypothetical protein